MTNPTQNTATALALAESALSAALRDLSALEADTITAPAELSAKITAAREAVNILDRRAAQARAEHRAAQAAEVRRKIETHLGEAARLEAEADALDTEARTWLLQRFAPGAVESLMLRGTNQANELRSLAANERGYAEQAEPGLKSLTNATR